MKIFAYAFLVLILFLSLSIAKSGTGSALDPLEPQEAKTLDEHTGSDGLGTDKVKPDSGADELNTGNGQAETFTTGERAIISGVPRYYQADMHIWGACDGDGFPTGCGPAAGASILGWWERRGIDGLFEGGQDSDGLPEETIEELGRGKYMDRITGCNQTAVLPDKFKSGLQLWLNEHSDIDFTITKHKITESSDIDYLWGIVKNEIDNGRPLVYLFRAGGEKESDGYLFANHYTPVVGYDELNGRKNLIVQMNWGDGNWSMEYSNAYMYDDSPSNNLLLTLGHYARPAAAINFNLYTIVPDETPDYEGECRGWLLDGQTFHTGSDDGYNTDDFNAYHYWFNDGYTWGPTDDLSYADRECFVATYHDKDNDGWFDGADNCPDLSNPYQTDSDDDGIGDDCDYPDLVPVMEYGSPSYTSEDLGDNKTRLSFTLETAIWNNGAEKIPAGSELTVKWSQESVEMGGGSKGEASTIKVTSIPARNKASKLAYNIFSKNGSKISSISAIPYNPLEHSSLTFTLPSDLEAGSYVTVNDQHFTATVQDGECVLITHTVDVIDSLAQELDESNMQTLEGYNTLTDCYGVMDVDIVSALENTGQIPVNSGKDLQAGITKAGMDQIIDIIKDVGPDGALIDVGPVILDIPEDAATGLIEVQISQKAKAGTLSVIKTFSPVYDIQAEKTFSKPATLRLSYSENLLGGISEQSLAIFENSGQGWKMIPSTVNADKNIVSAQLTHFSLYTVSEKKFNASKFLTKKDLNYTLNETDFNGKPAYKIKRMRKAKFLGLFDVEMEVETLVGKEKEEILEEKKPWWGFLALE